jgi:hypothetical protein
MKEEHLPPPISPFVVMADVDMAVTKVMTIVMAIIINVCPEIRLIPYNNHSIKNAFVF